MAIGSAAASSRWADALNYDAEAVRAAMTRGAQSVGPPPSEAAAFFADRPLRWSHPLKESFTHVQPDGSDFTVRMLEIEEGGGQVTPSGHLVVRGEDGWWYYGTRQANGKVAPGAVRVGKGTPPAITHHVAAPAEFKQNLAYFKQYGEQLRRWIHARNIAMAAEAKAAGEPLVFKIPALMLEINNTPFQPGSTPASIRDKYDGLGTSPTGTVTEMYLEQSFGQMVIQIDVYGIYTSALSMNPANDCWYGTDGGPVLGDTLGLGGYGAKGLATEAVPQADPEVDFAQYDQNGDNYVDFLMIVHSGFGAESSGDPCDVHSHYFGGLGPALVDGAPSEPTPVTADGVAIGAVLTVPERDANIGVVAHEIMHALGEPDYYGTAGTSGTGEWDLGAGGSWLGIPAQSNPIHFNPVMKVNFGWLEPRIITESTRDISLRPRAAYPDLVMVPVRTAAPGTPEADLCHQAPIASVPDQNRNFATADGGCYVEGFLIENLSRNAALSDAQACTIQPMDFDRQAYSSGMMVWHWDFESYQSLGNNNTQRPMLDIEEFNRRGPQELELNTTRGRPLNLYWGDPVGVSSATADRLPGSETGFPAPGPYTLNAPVPATSDTTEAWTAPTEVPEGLSMSVTLSWQTQDQDDWDLVLEKLSGDQWIEAGSAGAAPGSGPENITLVLEPGATYRAEGVNYASVSSTATVTVEYLLGVGPHKFGTASTWNADADQATDGLQPGPTGWAFTHIRPAEYQGLANATERPGEVITFDALLHDGSSVDVSGDFVRPGQTGAPLIAGQTAQFVTTVYQHGGADVSGVRVVVSDASGATVATFNEDLPGFGKRSLVFDYTPAEGLNELIVRATVVGDAVAQNDAVRSEFQASAAGTADLLLVDNDLGWTREEGVQAVLDALGVRYHTIAGEPSAATLANYPAVIWLTTTVSGAAGVMTQDAVDAITGFLDAGGKLWLASNRAPIYLGGPLGRAQEMAEYFGIVVQNNLLNSPGKITALTAAIGQNRELDLGYIDGRPYIDYVRLVDAGDGHTPKGEVSGLFVHHLAPNSLIGARLSGSFESIWTFDPNNLKFAEQRLSLIRDVLTAFAVPTGQVTAAVPSIKHNRFMHVQARQDWPLVVGARAPEGMRAVDLVYRSFGAGNWKRLALNPVIDGLYGGTIPGGDIYNNGLEYFVEATTNSGQIVRSASPQLPNIASAPYGDADPEANRCALPEPEAEVAVVAPETTGLRGGALGGFALLGLMAGLAWRRRQAWRPTA